DGVVIGPGEGTRGDKDTFTKLVLPDHPGIEIAKPPLVLAGSDHDTMPIVRISPQYPSGAQANGVEGWVQVRFNITTTGAVSDARVVDSNPHGVFDKAAVDAIARWRYNPRTEDGQATETRGVETVLRFELK
ncbi:MAG TPA: energy transducer TonB, partial [Candidatus Acidoferrum sp.]|nr:energy transducer TonB [Candidatus Acidoferrum sp.]